MEKLLDLQMAELFPSMAGFFFVRREFLDEEHIRLSFHEYLLKTREIVPVRRKAYLRRKFGPGYERIVERLGDYVSCDAACLPDGETVVLYPGGELGFFSKEGRPCWRGAFTYRGCGVSGLAADGAFFWSAVPEQNAVVRFSVATKKVVLRVGGGASHVFDGPCTLARYGRALYVCNERAHSISTVSLDRYVVRDYQHFHEPVYQFFRWQEEELAVLRSGVYLL
ncbi:MAG TPA: hypothetical protein IAD07_08145 [Candidatus Fimivicinus intestinavium]|nr:hypothetical protein [Candidatus Fimivicinus intestinavium]